MTRRRSTPLIITTKSSWREQKMLGSRNRPRRLGMEVSSRFSCSANHSYIVTRVKLSATQTILNSTWKNCSKSMKKSRRLHSSLRPNHCTTCYLNSSNHSHTRFVIIILHLITTKLCNSCEGIIQDGPGEVANMLTTILAVCRRRG
jgi:hypothetical protein